MCDEHQILFFATVASQIMPKIISQTAASAASTSSTTAVCILHAAATCIQKSTQHFLYRDIHFLVFVGRLTSFQHDEESASFYRYHFSTWWHFATMLRTSICKRRRTATKVVDEISTFSTSPSPVRAFHYCYQKSCCHNESSLAESCQNCRLRSRKSELFLSTCFR